MSQRQFSNRRQKEQRELPHSQKFVISTKKSYASKKLAAQLKTQLHNLTIQADQIQNQADFHWKKAKAYEAQGRIDMALESKTQCEEQALRARKYKLKIKQIEKEIDKLNGITLVGLEKGQNYATMKVEEPPSDN